MTGKIVLIVTRNIRAKRYKTVEIENVAMFYMENKLVFFGDGNISVVVYADTENVDVRNFSEKYGTAAISISKVNTKKRRK